MAAGIEHEHRFLVDSDSWRGDAVAPVRISQGWLFDDGDLQVRVRVAGTTGSVACKIRIGEPADGRRLELEDVVDTDLATLLLSRCAYTLDKTRWRVDVDGVSFDVDEYHGALAGLVTAELENPPPSYTPPAWTGADVTGVGVWSNAHLARFGRPDTGHLR